MTRLCLTIAYLGTHFSGWQIQEFKAKARPRTVQGELEAVLKRITGRKLRIFGAGRTDAGVHADAQVAHVDIPEDLPRRSPEAWQKSFAALLPHDVAVTAVCEVSPEFHARKSACGKRYSYGLWLTRNFVPPKLRNVVWETGPLDLRAMHAAAACLTGRHDFASLCNSGTEVATTVRTITAITCQEKSPLHLVWHVEAEGFLKQMVRNLVGLLVYAGRGKIDPASVSEYIRAGRRSALPSPTAPAKGLTLSKVYYDANEQRGLSASRGAP